MRPDTNVQVYNSKGYMLPIFLKCLTVTYFPDSNRAIVLWSWMSEIWNETNCKSLKHVKKKKTKTKPSYYGPEDSEVSQILFSGDDQKKSKS